VTVGRPPPFPDQIPVAGPIFAPKQVRYLKNLPGKLSQGLSYAVN
jgi:hypothetical protein